MRPSPSLARRNRPHRAGARQDSNAGAFIIEGEIPGNRRAGLGHAVVGAQIDLLVFDRALRSPPPCPARTPRRAFQQMITAAFDGGRITSDGGVMLLAAAERRLRLADRLAAAIHDPLIERA